MGIHNLLFKEGMRLKYFEKVVIVKAVSPTFVVIEDSFKKTLMLHPSDLIKAYRNQHVKIYRPASSIAYQPLTSEEGKYQFEMPLLRIEVDAAHFNEGLVNVDTRLTSLSHKTTKKGA